MEAGLLVAGYPLEGQKDLLVLATTVVAGESERLCLEIWMASWV
jgi:hypothetical protein